MAAKILHTKTKVIFSVERRNRSLTLMLSWFQFIYVHTVQSLKYLENVCLVKTLIEDLR